MDYKSRSQSKLMGDAQKAYNRTNAEGDGGKVHIPETFEDSDSDSESFADKVKQLTGMDEDKAKKGNKGESSKQMWFVKDIVNEIDPKSFLPATKLIETNTSVMIPESDLSDKQNEKSPIESTIANLPTQSP